MLAKGILLAKSGGDPDFSSVMPDKATAGKPGMMPVGVNHTLALFDVLTQIDEGKIPGTDKMDKSGKESYKQKVLQDYTKDMGSYGFTPDQVKQIYYDVKGGYKTNNFGTTVRGGLQWNTSQGAGETNDEMRTKSQRVLIHRNYGTGSDNYVYKEGTIDEPQEMKDRRQMIANFLAQKKP